MKELERAKKEGYRGVALSAWPSGGDNLRPEDDPFWDTAAELDMPVSIHLLLAAQQSKMGASNKGSVAIGASAFMYTMPLMVEFIFQGVFDRFPKLRMAFVEVGAGLDSALPRDGGRSLLAESALDEHDGQEGAERVLQGPLHRDVHRRPQRRLGPPSGRPRQPGLVDRLPAPRQRLAVLAQDDRRACSSNVPDEERQKIICENAARFWGLG